MCIYYYLCVLKVNGLKVSSNNINARNSETFLTNLGRIIIWRAVYNWNHRAKRAQKFKNIFVKFRTDYLRSVSIPTTFQLKMVRLSLFCYVLRHSVPDTRQPSRKAIILWPSGYHLAMNRHYWSWKLYRVFLLFALSHLHLSPPDARCASKRFSSIVLLFAIENMNIVFL